MKIGLCQLDARVGDLRTNAAKIRGAVGAAAEAGAQLVVLPELAITGYPPRDLLFDADFLAEVARSVAALATALAGGPPVLLGAPAPSGAITPGHPGLLNAALWLEGGEVRHTIGKRLLPTYDVFDERRWFVPGAPTAPLAAFSRRIAPIVCEDLWDEGYGLPPDAVPGAGAELIVSLNASPFRAGILAKRRAVARRRGVPLVYVNAAGANDSLIFDGGSFALNARGEVIAALPRFAEAVHVVDLDRDPPVVEEEPSDPELLFRATVAGVRGFFAKNGLRRAVLGLSGGIDSALVALLAVHALGGDRVTAVAMPSRFSDRRSTESAEILAKRLGLRFEVVPIDALHAAAEAALPGALTAGLAGENLQARLRMLILGGFVNAEGGALLNTSNHTELALGYGTLWGDLAGVLAPIGDLSKPEVYAVSRWASRHVAEIPSFILDRPPSAELRPDQVDPFDYPVVGPLADALARGLPLPEGVDPALVADLRARIRASEVKRVTHGIVLMLHERAFGEGRKIPVTRA